MSYVANPLPHILTESKVPNLDKSDLNYNLTTPCATALRPLCFHNVLEK